MNKAIITSAVVATGVLLTAGTVQAQTLPGEQNLQVYGGEIFGDRLTSVPLSGSHPWLDDNMTFGARYTFGVTPRWGLQFSGGYSPSRASHVAGGASDLGLTTADLDLVWSFLPDLVLQGHRTALYAVAGGGYAWTHLDHALMGTIAGTPVMLTEGNGVSGNAGFGGKFYVTEHLFIGADARYRYFDQLVNSYDRGLNTAETTLSVGYAF